ncbi:MAG: outer membrane beta-barrel protein [Paludibacter sp.]
MKRTLFLITWLYISFIAKAQYSDNPIRNFDLTRINLEQLKFGLKVSPSISWINVGNNDAIAGGATMKLGIGVTAHYEINDLLAIVSAINYNSIGGYMADTRSFADVNANDYFKVNYGIVEVPLGLKIKTPTVNKYNYYLQGGVTTGFILSANERMYKSSGSGVYKSYDLMKDLTYPSIAGFFVGLGSRYTINDKFKLFVEVNYKHALTSISNAENYMTDPNHNYTEALYIIPANMEFSFGVEF